ncbi:hypothetical protein BDQ17DRAFT_1434244 [Cyathus striatus]|nr:hypothetical protein BDQ17DRAFT_1434244 [Cyathus striatus]
MTSATLHPIFAQVEKLSNLIPLLPDSIPLAKENGTIDRIFKGIPAPSSPTGDHWGLWNIQRSQFGMDLVIDYIRFAVKSSIPHDIAAIKVDCLVAELEKLISSSGGSLTLGTQTLNKRCSSITVEGVEDEDYLPSKWLHQEPPSPTRVYDSDGSEFLEDTEQYETMKRKCNNKAALESKGTELKDLLEISDSGDESDGKSAFGLLRNVSRSKVGNQGLQTQACNISMTLLQLRTRMEASIGNSNVATVCGKAVHINIMYYSHYTLLSLWTVQRTAEGKNVTFDDEGTLPKLNNLASHATECQKKRAIVEENDSEKKPKAADFNYKKSAEFMESYLHEGELNPAAVVMKKGFFVSSQLGYLMKAFLGPLGKPHLFEYS